MRKWKYGVSFAEESPMTAPLPMAGNLYENMEKARQFGYDAVEFHARETYQYDVEKLRTLRNAGKGSICALSTGRLLTYGGLCLIDDSPEKRAAALTGLKMYIDKAQMLEVNSIIVGLARGSVPAGCSRSEKITLLENSFTELNAYAKERGVRVFLEAINRYETNVFNTAEEILDFITRHDLDQFFVHLDTFHMNIEEHNPYEAIRKCGKKLGYFHVADNTRRYPGSGQLDFKRILAALYEIDYDGYIAVECIPDPDRETTARKAIEHLIACEP